MWMDHFWKTMPCSTGLLWVCKTGVFCFWLLPPLFQSTNPILGPHLCYFICDLSNGTIFLILFVLLFYKAFYRLRGAYTYSSDMLFWSDCFCKFQYWLSYFCSIISGIVRCRKNRYDHCLNFSLEITTSNCSEEVLFVHCPDAMLAPILHWEDFVIMLSKHICLVLVFHVLWMVSNLFSPYQVDYWNFFLHKVVSHWVSLTDPTFCLITFSLNIQSWMEWWFSFLQQLCDHVGSHFRHPFHLHLNFQKICILEVSYSCPLPLLFAKESNLPIPSPPSPLPLINHKGKSLIKTWLKSRVKMGCRFLNLGLCRDITNPVNLKILLYGVDQECLIWMFHNHSTCVFHLLEMHRHPSAFYMKFLPKSLTTWSVMFTRLHNTESSYMFACTVDPY